MKYRIEFEVEHEEYDRLQRIIKGEDLFCAVQDFSEWLRSEIKYKDKDYDEVRHRFYECLKERDIGDIW